MSEPKRFFWLKLQHDFFKSKRIKKLRRMQDGDTLLLIYMKMQLLSIKTNGVLSFMGLEATFAEELALDLEEDEELVERTIEYLLKFELMFKESTNTYILPFVRDNTGSETAVAQRVRECRERQKVLQSNEKALQSNIMPLHCNNSVTESKSKSKSKNIYNKMMSNNVCYADIEEELLRSN